MSGPEDIGLETLTPVVCRILSHDAVEVLDWRFEKFGGGATAAEVYRFAGRADVEGHVSNWSVVLKCLPPPVRDSEELLAPTEDPESALDWKREFLLYTSGILTSLPEGFSAPQCFLAEEKEGVCRLWIEDLGDIDLPVWSRERYGLAAYHLGLFNGQPLAEKTVPSLTWLNNADVRNRSNSLAMTEAQLSTALETVSHVEPLRSVWNDEMINATHEVLADRELFLDAIDRLPKTFLHNDSYKKNLATRMDDSGTVTTVALDWGFVGTGAIGGDLAELVIASSRWFGGIKPDQLPEFEEVLYARHLQGMRTAGWQGNEEDLRLGYLLSSILLFGPGWLAPLANPSENVLLWVESSFHRPYEEVTLRWSQVNRHVLTLAEEARTYL